MSWQLVGNVAGKDVDTSLIKELRAEIANCRSELLAAKTANVAEMASLRSEVAKAVGSLPDPKDGSPWKSIDLSELDAMVAERVERAVALMPIPKDGTDGKSLTVEEVAPLVRTEVTKQIQALPKPKDPVGISGAVVSRDGSLVFTFSDGSTKDVGIVVGRDADVSEMRRAIIDEIAKLPVPKDGKDGLDGLGFDEMTVEHDGERTFTIKAMRGERVKELGRFVVPAQIYRGVYEAGKGYERGDTTTWAGSMWHATTTTTAKPGESKDWTLCVQRGREGKPGTKGDKGDQGDRGPMGPQGKPVY